MVKNCTTCYYRFKKELSRCFACRDEYNGEYTRWRPNEAIQHNMEVAMKKHNLEVAMEEKAKEEEKEETCCGECSCEVQENENGTMYIDVEDLMSREITLELKEKEINILLNKAIVDILNDAIKKHEAEIEEWKEEE